MSVTSDPDTMYYHQAMREPDAGNFVDAAEEWNLPASGKSISTRGNDTVSGSVGHEAEEMSQDSRDLQVEGLT